jgi:hypothetical protein
MLPVEVAGDKLRGARRPKITKYLEKINVVWNAFDLNLSVENRYVTIKIYDNRDDFNFNNFNIVNFRF